MAYGENTIQKPTFLANTLTTGTHVISATEESGLVIDFPTENNQNTSDNENFGDLLLYNKADLQLTASAYSYDILLTESGDIGESGYVWKANSDATTEYKGTFNDYVLMPMNKYITELATSVNTVINFSSINSNYIRVISAIEIKDSANLNPILLVVFVADGGADDGKVYSSYYYEILISASWSTPVQIGTIHTTGRYSGALYKLTDGTVLFTMITAAARTLTTYKWTLSGNTWATYGSTKDLSQFTQVAIGGAAVDDYNTVVMGVCDPSITYPYPCVLVSYGGTGDWTEPIVLFDYGGSPSIAYKKDGKFLAVWEEHTNRIGNTQSFDILAKESIDGKTWTLLDTEDLTGTVLSDYITPNDDILGLSYNQFHLPKIAILSDGRIAVIAFYDQNLSYIDNVGSADYGLALVISDNSVGDSWKYYTKLTHQGVPTTKADTTLHTLIGKTQAELTIGYLNNNVDQYGNCLVIYNNELLYIHSPKPTTNTKIILFSRILPNQKTIFLNTPNAVPYHTACLAIPDTATAFWEQEGAGTTTFSYSNEFVDIPAGVTYHADDLSSLNTITFNARGIYGFTSWSCQKFATSDTAKIKFDFVKENDTASANWLGRATEVTMTEAAGTVTIQADGNTIGTISSVNDTKEYEFIFVCGQQESGLDSTDLLLKGFYKQNTSDKWTSLTGYTNALITSSGITACDVHWGSQAGDNSHWRWFYLYTGCPLNTWEATKQAGYYPGEATTVNSEDTSQRAIRVLIAKGSIKKSGKKIRIKLKNTMGGGFQANYTRVTIAEKETGAYVDNLVDYTEKNITFQDAASITLAAGTETWSDWIDFDFDEEKDYFICLANGVYRIPYLSNKAAVTTNFTYYKTAQTEQYNSDWDDPPEETITGGSKQTYIAGVVWEIQVLEDEGNNRDLLNENNLNYKKLTGRKTSVYPQHIQNGIDVYFGGNRGANEDQWLVQTKWLYAKENVILGSPSKEWRSRQDDTAINIVISKGANEYENGSIALINTNFISCNLRRVSDNGLIAALDSTISSLSSLAFTLAGSMVHIIYSGTDDKRYIGKYIKFQNPSGNTEVRKVVSSFKYAATTLAMELDTTPSIASINSMVLYTDRMYSIGTLDAAFTETQLKIEITSQSAYGGYYKIGKCIFGQHLTLNEYRSEGSTHTLTGQVDITKTRAGVMFPGKKGEAYRTITLNFEYADVETQMEVDNFIKYIDFGKHPFIYWDEQSIPDDAILMRMTDQTIPRKHIARGDLFTIEQFTLTEEL